MSWRSIYGKTFFVSSDRSLLSIDHWTHIYYYVLSTHWVLCLVYIVVCKVPALSHAFLIREAETNQMTSTSSGESGQPKPIMVGFICLISNSAGFNSCTFLADFYLLPLYVRLGFGKALFSRTKDHPTGSVYRQLTRLSSDDLKNGRGIC